MSAEDVLKEAMASLKPGEVVFVLKSTNALAVEVMQEYIDIATLSDIPNRHIEGCEVVQDQMRAWQKDNPTLVTFPG